MGKLPNIPLEDMEDQEGFNQILATGGLNATNFAN